MLSLITGILIVGGIISIIMGVIIGTSSLVTGGVIALFLSAGLSFFLYKRAPEIDAAKKIKKFTPLLSATLLKVEDKRFQIERKIAELEVLYSKLQAIFESKKNVLESQLEKPFIKVSQDWESRAKLYLQKRQHSQIVDGHNDTIQNTNLSNSPVVQPSETSPVVEAKLATLESHYSPSSSSGFQNPQISPVPDAEQQTLKSALRQLNLDLYKCEVILDEQDNTLCVLNDLVNTAVVFLEKAEHELTTLENEVNEVSLTFK